MRDLAIGFIAAAGLLSALLTFLTARWEDLSLRLRVRKGLLIFAFLTVGIGATIVSMPRPERRAAAAETRAEITNMVLPTTPAPSTSRPALTPSSHTNSDPVTAPRITRTRPIQPRLRITDANGASVDQLIAAGKDLRAAYSLRGVLHERSEQSPQLQDLYTVHLTLSATITHRDDVISAFTLTARGGGFQIEAARAQALDRLTATFRARLQEVP